MDLINHLNQELFYAEIFMKNSIVRRIIAPISRVLLLLALTFLTIFGQAEATLYTYTSPEFDRMYGPMIPGQPATIGDRLTVEFRYDAALPTDLYLGFWPVPLPPGTWFSMSAGSLSVSSLSPSLLSVNLGIGSADGVSVGIWDIEAHVALPNNENYYAVLLARYVPNSSSAAYLDMRPYIQNAPGDHTVVCYNSITGPYDWGGDPAPVPCTATVLLLASGLMPLAWSCRKRRWRK